MYLETPEYADFVQLVQQPPTDEGPPPYVLHQTIQVAPYFDGAGVVNEADTQLNAVTYAAAPVDPDTLARFFSRFDLMKNKQVGHTAVAILLFFITIMVMVNANDKTGDEKSSLYESMAMNSVAFIMIYFTTRLPNKPTSTYYKVHRALEIVGIGISVFLFLASLLVYINIVSASASSGDSNLVMAILFLLCAMGIEVLVFFLLIIKLRSNKNRTRRNGGADADNAVE